MTVFAVLRDGSEVELASSLGADVSEVHTNLRSVALTGSAVALDDRELETAAGKTIRYVDVNRFEDQRSFR